MNIQAPNWNLNNAIADIYKAALEPELWPSALNNMCCLLDSSHASLLFLDKLEQQTIVITTRGIYSNNTDEDLLTFKIIHNKLLSIPLGECVLLDHEQLIQHSHVSSTVVLSFKTPKLLIPLFLKDDCGVALLISNNNHLIRSPNSHTVIKQLSAHLIKALHIHNHLSVLKHRNNSMQATLKQTSIPVFILNTDLRVMFNNKEAEQLLAHQPALKLNSKGYLQVFFSEEKKALTRILNDFLVKDFHIIGWHEDAISLAIRHPDKTHPIRLCFLPLQKPGIQQAKNPFIAIFAYDPELPRHTAPEYLQQAFNLTPAEIHIAQLLASGFNISEIAEIRHTTIESTRWQMKQVLQKTNTHSQAELMRMLVVLSQNFNSDSYSSPTTPMNIEITP